MNTLEISYLRAFFKDGGNDLATVANSVIYGVFLSNNSCSICKISTFF